MKSALRFGEQIAKSFAKSLKNTSVLANRLKRRLVDGKINPAPYPMLRFTTDLPHTFFGYYDTTPFSADGLELLAISTLQDRIDNKGNHTEAVVGYFDIASQQFTPVSSTTTWCWQMGCRLRWWPQSPNKHIVYNQLVNGRYGAVVQDIENRTIIRTYDRPLYDISRDGRWGLSLNFSRLQRLRPGYGYDNLPDQTENSSTPDEDGVWLIDMKSGSSQLLLSLAQLVGLSPLSCMADAEHYVNHLAFNPSASRFVFYHMWRTQKQRYTRMLTSDIAAQSIHILSNEKEYEGCASHLTWKSNQYLLVAYDSASDITANPPKFEYLLFKDGSDTRIIVAEDYLTEDGHPSFFMEGHSCILADAYPDSYGERKLLLYCPDKETPLTILGHFYCPPKYRKGESRCDLHPRTDGAGRLCFDSTHNDERRSLYIMDCRDDNIF